MTDPVDPNALPYYEPPGPPPSTGAPAYPMHAPQASGYGYPPWAGQPPPAPAGQRRAVLVVVGGLLVAVLVTAGLTYWLTRDSATKPLAVPDSFDGYVHLHNAASDQVEKSMHSVLSSMGPGVGDVFDKATIAIYGKTDSPSLITLVVPTDAVPGAPSSAGARVDALLGGALPGSGTAYPSAGHSGSEKCGNTDFGALSETMCGWSDDTVSGLLVSVNPALAPADAAVVTTALRDSLH